MATTTQHNLANDRARAATSVRPPWFYHAMALATVLVWSFSFLHIIILNEHIDPLSVVVLRKDIFLVLLIGLILWRRPPIAHMGPRDWALVIGMSLVVGPLYHFTFAWSAGVDASGANRIEVGLLGLILATTPIHAGWLGWVFLRERLTIVRIVALALGLGGVWVVILGKQKHIDLVPAHLAGPIAATGAALFSAFGAILTRACRTVLRPVDLFLISGVIIVGVVALFHPAADFERIGAMGGLGWWAACFLGICGSGIAYLCWVAALSGLQTVTVAMYLFLASTLAALWGWLFRGEAVGWLFAVGGAMVLAGLVLPALAQNGKRRARVATPAIQEGTT